MHWRLLLFNKINKIMKINLIQFVIALAISLLIAYGFYSFYESEQKTLLSVGSFVFLSITLILTIGTNFDSTRSTTNVRVFSGIFFLIGLISNLIFSFIDFSTAGYLITNGILLLVFILIAYSIQKAKQ